MLDVPEPTSRVGDTPEAESVEAGDEFELTESAAEPVSREAQLQASLEAALESERQAKARCRELAAELRAVREAGVENEQSRAGEASSGYLGDRDRNLWGAGGPESDLVTACLRELRSQLPELVREVVADSLPRQRGILVHVPDEGVARVPVEEVVSKTYGSLVALVLKLADHAATASGETGLWAFGVDEGVASLLEQAAAAAPRRPKVQIRSRTLA